MKKFILPLSLLQLFLFSLACTSSKKTIIAHRGASGYLPEHTLEAQSMAHSWNVDYIEPDVVLTKDNQPIILHDVQIDTTTNVAQVFPKKRRKDGRFYAIDLTLKQIKKLKVNERIDLKSKRPVFANRFPLNSSSFKIPTLQESLDLVKGLNKSRGQNIGLYIEIKHPEFHLKHKKDITQIVMDVLGKKEYSSLKLILQCFYTPTLKRLKNDFKTTIPLVQLIAENDWGESSIDYDKMKTKAGIKQIATYADGIGPWIPQLMRKPEIVKWAHENKLIVHPYTARKDAPYPGLESFEKLHDYLFKELNVDGVFSDFADLSIQYR